MAQLAEASPDSTVEYRTRLLQSLTEVDESTDRKEIAEKVEALNLSATLAQLKADHLMHCMTSLAHDDRKATIGALVRLVDNLSDEERATLAAALQNSTRSPGSSS